MHLDCMHCTVLTGTPFLLWLVGLGGLWLWLVSSRFETWLNVHCDLVEPHLMPAKCAGPDERRYLAFWKIFHTLQSPAMRVGSPKQR